MRFFLKLSCIIFLGTLILPAAHASLSGYMSYYFIDTPAHVLKCAWTTRSECVYFLPQTTPPEEVDTLPKPNWFNLPVLWRSESKPIPVKVHTRTNLDFVLDRVLHKILWQMPLRFMKNHPLIAIFVVLPIVIYYFEGPFNKMWKPLNKIWKTDFAKYLRKIEIEERAVSAVPIRLHSSCSAAPGRPAPAASVRAAAPVAAATASR